MKYSQLHGHSFFSSLDSPAKPEDIINRACELELNAIAITEHGNVGSAVQIEKFGKKKGIKVIKGMEAYISKDDSKIKSKENSKLSHLVILAKNAVGWKTLLKIVSESNSKDRFYHKPRIDLKTLASLLDGNILCINGHVGSSLSDSLFTDFKAAYGSKTLQEASSFLSPNWKKEVSRLAEYHRDIFGKENFFIEIQNLNQDTMPAAKIVADCLRQISKATKIPCVASADPHFTLEQHKRDQQVLLCSAFKTTLRQVSKQISSGEDVGLAGFFNKDSIYHIPSVAELRYNTEEEIANTNLVADMCESYEITGPPILPSFDCPNKQSQIEYLKVLARQGWKRLGIVGNEYAERAKHELDVIERANLAGYFLMVQDYVKYIKDNNWLIGPGRGSGAGSLIGYLIGITNIDPIKYNLSFERFYNEGRNTKDRVALPDYDCDFPKKHRYDVFNYLRNKHGSDKFAHLCTFIKLKGKSALKDVLRVTDACDASTANDITSYIPDEAAISDELQNMKEVGEEPSIILWALQNRPKELAKYCALQDNGILVGEYAKQFEQAIRLEGCIRGMSRHASAVVVGASPLNEIVPMTYDKTSSDLICGWDMHDAEAAGLVKLDVLGVNAIDKIMDCVND